MQGVRKSKIDNERIFKKKFHEKSRKALEKSLIAIVSRNIIPLKDSAILFHKSKNHSRTSWIMDYVLKDLKL